MVLCKCSSQIILTSIYLVEGGLAWWDWPGALTKCCSSVLDTVGWVIWPVKVVPNIIITYVWWDVKPYSTLPIAATVSFSTRRLSAILFYVHFFGEIEFLIPFDSEWRVLYIPDNSISLVEVSISFFLFYLQRAPDCLVLCTTANHILTIWHRILQIIRQCVKHSWCISSHVTEVCARIG